MNVDVAMKYVKSRTVFAKKFRNYAVSDFVLYNEWIRPSKTANKVPLAEFQKTWALYLWWVAKCKADSGAWSSANGASFSGKPEPSRKFLYQPSGSETVAPTVDAWKKGPWSGGIQEAKLDGVGQCEYFAMQAYQDLVGNKQGTKDTPLIEKISTPGHNWVIVNRVKDTDVSEWIVVDYWFLALGVPMQFCICSWNSALANFDADSIKVVESFNPNNEDTF